MTLLSEPTAEQAATDRPSADEVYSLVAALSAMVAGAIHLAVVPAHWGISWAIPTFFLVLGLAQLALAASFRWRLAPSVLAGAIVAHLGVIALYVSSRTTDLPFIPPHDVGHEVKHLPVAGGVGNGIPIYPGSRAEPVGFVDVACLVAELVLIAMMVGLLPARWRTGLTTAMVALGVVAVAARAAGILA